MADARVQSAISHWAPRFVQAGMDYSDFMRVGNGVERWEDWLDAFAALGDRHAQRAEEAEHADRRVTAGEAWLHAAVAYHFAKFVWVRRRRPRACGGRPGGRRDLRRPPPPRPVGRADRGAARRRDASSGTCACRGTTRTRRSSS